MSHRPQSIKDFSSPGTGAYSSTKRKQDKIMSEYLGFSVIVQYHDQPPIDTKAFRPIKAREFLPGMTLAEVWDWVRLHQDGCRIETVLIRELET